MPVSRRKFLGLSGAALIAAWAKPASAQFAYDLFPQEAAQQQAQQAYAEKWFDGFPESLPGAYKVEKAVRTKGAKHTLVHVRQMHYRPEATDADLADVNAVQDGVYKALSELIDRKIVSSVYDEGTTEFGVELMRLYQDQKQMLRDIEGMREFGFLKKMDDFLVKRYQAMLEEYSEMLKMEKDPARTAAITQQIKKIGAELSKIEGSKRQLEKIQAGAEKLAGEIREKIGAYEKLQEKINGAVGRLGNEGRIAVNAAENYEANLRGEIALDKQMVFVYESILAGQPVPDEAKKLPEEVTEMREDLLLRIISEAGNPAALTVYGAAHDWRNNVKKWNAAHPESGFSLIVVTPEAYQKLRPE